MLSAEELNAIRQRVSEKTDTDAARLLDYVDELRIEALVLDVKVREMARWILECLKKVDK